MNSREESKVPVQEQLPPLEEPARALTEGEKNETRYREVVEKLRSKGPNKFLCREISRFLRKIRKNECNFCHTDEFLTNMFTNCWCEKCGNGHNDPEISFITDRIYVGNDEFAREREGLKAVGITHIIVAGPFELYYPEDFTYLHLNIADAERFLEYVDESNKFIDKASRVFVHCGNGLSLSPSLVIAYIMWKRGINFEKTLKFVKEQRTFVNPIRTIREQLDRYERILHGIQGKLENMKGKEPKWEVQNKL